MRKPDSTKSKGKPRGRAAAKLKEMALVDGIPISATPAEPADKALQAAVAAQVAARFAVLEAQPELEAERVPEPPREPPRPRQDAATMDAEIRAAIPALTPPPVAQDPAIKQQEVLGALVQEQRAAAQAKTPAEMQLPPRRKSETTQQYTERLVDVMVAAQMERRKLVLERRRLKQPIGDIPPVNVYVPTRNDEAAAPEGAKLRDGWWQQWIPTKNTAGEPDPSLTKVQGMRSWGYEVVTDPAGKPVQGKLGVLMQGPPERRAARQAQLTPVGARKPREQEESFLQKIEDINREHGRTVLKAEERSSKEHF